MVINEVSSMGGDNKSARLYYCIIIEAIDPEHYPRPRGLATA